MIRQTYKKEMKYQIKKKAIECDASVKQLVQPYCNPVYWSKIMNNDNVALGDVVVEIAEMLGYDIEIRLVRKQ